MAEFPALPLWTDRYLADTTHLADAEHGIYLLLLMHLWRTPQQRFPNDPAWIARKMGRSVEAFEKQVFPLMQEFMQCDGNWWTQKRLSMEWNYVKKTSDKRSEAAKSRWNNKTPLSPADAPVCISPADAPTPTPTPTPYKKEKTSPSEMQKVGSRLVSEWQPSAGDVDFAQRLGLGVNSVREQFVDYWIAQPGAKGRKADWSATWRNWCRRAAEKIPRVNGHAKNGNGHAIVGFAVGSREWWEMVRDMRGYNITPEQREKYEAKYGKPQ